MSKSVEYGRVFARWAEECGFDLATAGEVVRLAVRCGMLHTHESNGDAHPRVEDRKNKNENARQWGRDFDRCNNNLVALVKPFGFTVEYNGLFPSLHRDGTGTGDSIIIPTDR